MGVRATLAGITPSATHISFAQTSGHGNPQLLLTLAMQHCTDAIDLLTQIKSDMTNGSGSDSNISTITSQITALS
jgi:hypothetical protein